MENELIFVFAGIALGAVGVATGWLRRPLGDELPPHPATRADTAVHPVVER